MRRSSASQARVPLEDRLWARRAELEQATLARISAISDPAAAANPDYLAGLRLALTAALDYGLSAIADPGREPEPVPVQLLAQARLAARNGVSLEAVLRRYAAGHSYLADSLLDEAANLGIGFAELKVALRALAARYDRVVAAVSEEHAREARPEPQNAERRRYKLLHRLLAGERLDASELGYELDGHHLALVASGSAGERALAILGEQLDRRILLVAPEEQSAWAWLGGRRQFERPELDFLASYPWPEGTMLACGTPARGVVGWRLSHRQARAALRVALRRPQRFTRYSDVGMLATIVGDDDLVAYLTETYLTPLASERDGGETLRQTLRAYFAAGGNIASAASTLNVTRQTVTNRLRTVEERLDRLLDTCRAEMEVALELVGL